MSKWIYLPVWIAVAFITGCNGQSTVKTAQPAVAVQASAEQSGETGPIHLTKAEFLKLVMDYEKNPDNWVFAGEKPCLIDFYADWCAPCRITSPILEDLSQQYAGRINVYKIDIEKEEELAAVFGVQSIPTFLFCPLDGRPTISSGIANSPEATKAMFIQQIEELLLKGPSGSSAI